MSVPPIELNNHAGFSPEEVHLVAVDPRIAFEIEDAGAETEASPAPLSNEFAAHRRANQ